MSDQSAVKLAFEAHYGPDTERFGGLRNSMLAAFAAGHASRDAEVAAQPIPVAPESLPTVGADVLYFHEHRGWHASKDWRGGWECPTFWLPLPPPPETP